MYSQVAKIIGQEGIENIELYILKLYLYHGAYYPEFSLVHNFT